MIGLIFLLCGFGMIAYFFYVHFTGQPRPLKRRKSERKKYYDYMRKLGCDEVDILDSYRKIESYSRLQELNKELEEVCDKYKL